MKDELELSFFTEKENVKKKTPINTKKRKEIKEETTAALAGLLSKESTLTLILLLFSSLSDPLSLVSLVLLPHQGFFPFFFFLHCLFLICDIKDYRTKKEKTLPKKKRETKLIYRFAVIVAVIGKVPLDELFQPGLQIGGWLVSEFSPGGTNIRVSKRNVAVSRHVHDIPLRLNLQMSLQDTHKSGHGNGRSVPEVKYPIRSGSPFLPTRPGTLASGIQGAKAPLHDIINVGKIASEVGVVFTAVDGDGFPL